MFVPIRSESFTILTFCNKTYTDYTSTGAHVYDYRLGGNLSFSQVCATIVGDILWV